MGKWILCESCGDPTRKINSNSNFCAFCLEHNGPKKTKTDFGETKPTKVSKTKTKEEKLTEKKVDHAVRTCQFCKEFYKPTTKLQKLCSDLCREQNKIKLANEKWLISKPVVRKKQDLQKIMRGDFSNKWKPSLRHFNAVRG